MKDKETLHKIYDQGINRSWWKSHLPHDPIEDAKINQLRKLLELPLLHKALPAGYYDKQSVDELRNIDFSSLDDLLHPLHNLTRYCILEFKLFTCGLAPLNEGMDVTGGITIPDLD